MLSTAQLDDLDRRGYVVVEDAVDAAWVARLRLAFDVSEGSPSGTQHVALTDATPELAAWRALAEHPVIAAAAAHVLARPFRVRDLHGRNPRPGFGRQGLHADAVPRASGDAYAVVTALWMLDDFAADNGATRLVPGSHRSPYPLPRRLAQPLARHADEVIVTGRAGDVLVFNGHLWHSGRRNDSARPRRAAQMVVVAEDAAGAGAGSQATRGDPDHR